MHYRLFCVLHCLIDIVVDTVDKGPLVYYELVELFVYCSETVDAGDKVVDLLASLLVEFFVKLVLEKFVFHALFLHWGELDRRVYASRFVGLELPEVLLLLGAKLPCGLSDFRS